MTLASQPRSFATRAAGGVLTITLARPARKNALTFEVYRELTAYLRALQADESVRAVVIGGEGGAFCSGGDVEEIIGALFALDAPGLLSFTRLTGELIGALRTLRRPVIAAVDGVAAGAGAVIALACDIRIASPRASFAFLFPKVGLTGADMGAASLLPRVVGLGHASELLFTGDRVDAEHALRIGLVNRIAPDADEAAHALATRLASGPAFAHATTKQMLEAEATMPLAAALEAEAQAQALCMMHGDFRTAHDAWNEKRAPRFSGAPGDFVAGPTKAEHAPYARARPR